MFLLEIYGRLLWCAGCLLFWCVYAAGRMEHLASLEVNVAHCTEWLRYNPPQMFDVTTISGHAKTRFGAPDKYAFQASTKAF